MGNTLGVAFAFDDVLNGLARPFFGWMSDIIGRENTMVIAFSRRCSHIGGSAKPATPYLFIILSGIMFFSWGEIFSLFPSTCTDIFGAKYAATNAGMLYTAKGTAAWIVPLTSLLKNYSGHWHWVFVIATAMNLWLPRLRCSYSSRCGGGSSGRMQASAKGAAM